MGGGLRNYKYFFHFLQTHQQLRLPVQNAVQSLPGITVETRHSIDFSNVGKDCFGVDLPYTSTGKYVYKFLAGVRGEDGWGGVGLAIELLGAVNIFRKFIGGDLFKGVVVEDIGGEVGPRRVEDVE